MCEAQFCFLFSANAKGVEIVDELRVGAEALELIPNTENRLVQTPQARRTPRLIISDSERSGA